MDTIRKKLLHCVFEDQVAQRAHSVAVEHHGRTITYGQLNGKANQLAHLLRAEGIGKEVVGLILNPGIAYIVAKLGVLKAGAVFMPMDLAHPVRRMQFMIDQSGTSTLVVEAGELPVVDQLPEKANLKTVITVDEAFSLRRYAVTAGGLTETSLDGAGADASNPVVVNDPDDGSYILYTSGSTGVPKGIMGRQKSIAHFINWERKQFELGPDVRVAHTAPVTFDPSLRDIFIPLTSGGTVCIPTPEEKTNSSKMLTFLENARISLIHIVPSMFRLLTKELLEEQHTGERLKDLKYVLLAGEPLYGKDVKDWEQVMGDRVTLANLYGPTETTQSKLFYLIPKKNDYSTFPNRMVPVGRPIGNTEEIIYENGRLCKTGEVGEIYIKTPFITRGYLNNPELNKSFFVQNPLHHDFEDIVYKSGDLGRYLPDGNVELIGRKDLQVKINGIRVELEEVELCLKGFPKISESLVLAKEVSLGDKKMVAYYVGREAFGVEELRAYLKEHLPATMIPTYFVALKAFPLTLNGKVDKKALPEPDVRPEQDHVPAATRTEKALAAIWEAVLGWNQVGVTESFLNFGAHSLKAIQIVSRIYKELGVEVKLGDLFRTPTIRELAGQIDQKVKAKYQQIAPVSRQEHYAVSNAQKRLWVMHQLDKQQTAYNISNGSVLSGALDRAAFEDAFQTVTGRHESLRTTFITVEGEPRQKIHAPASFGFAVNYTDLRNAPEAGAADRVIAAEEETPFDLENGPLLRARLLQTGDREYILCFTIHHIIADGWSIQVLVNELITAYNARVHGQESRLAPLYIQYKDYAAWQLAQLEGDTLRDHEAFWLDQFSGELPVLNLPTDFPRPAAKTFRGACIEFRLDKATNQQLDGLSRARGATRFMFLMASTAALLYRYTGDEDIVIGFPIAGREHPDLEQQIGFYVNTLPLRVRFKGGESFDALLDAVRRSTLSAYEHQAYPLDVLVEKLALNTPMSRSPLFDVMAGLHNSAEAFAAGNRPELEGITVRAYPIHKTISKFDLTFNFSESEEELFGNVEYNQDLFTAETVRRLIAHYQNLVASVIADSSTALNALEYLTRAEQVQLLETFNDTRTAYPADCTIPQLFEAQAAATPGLTALVYEGCQFSYHDVNQASNSLAHFLRDRLGVRPGQVVGMLMDRSEMMYIGILGILKAGAAYLPLDVTSPAERIRYMLDKASAKVVLLDDRQRQHALPVPHEAYDKVVLQDDWKLIAGCSKENPRREDAAADLAYIMYTSGSTGQPKGVAVEHRNVIRLVRNTNYAAITPGDRILQLSNYAFDGSVFDIFGALLNGACLHVPDMQTVLSHKQLADFIAGSDVNVTFITTALFNSLVELSPATIGRFDKIYFGGENVSVAHVRRALAHARRPGAVVHVYGPTEATTFSTYHVVESLPEAAVTVPIGKPLANAKAYVLDKYLGLVPVGVPGEIYLAGDGLARGYYNEPALTEERFIRNPFAGGDERLYKTGDLGRWLPDGSIEFIGRRDNQVKIRGFRIELGEIERVLMAYEHIKECLVMVKEDQEKDKSVWAFVVPQGDFELSRLYGYVKKLLPGYMIPARFIELAQLPLNTNGKVDQKALLRSVEDQPDGTVAYAAPANLYEDKLAEIWKKLLGKKRIGIDDNFFELGGHSLKATRMISFLYKEFNTKIELRDVYESPTVRQLAARIARAETTAYQPVEPVGEQAYYDISHAQKRLWILSQLDDKQYAFNMPAAYLLEGDLHPGMLRKTFAAVMNRHEILRTTIVLVKGEPKQKVNALDALRFSVEHVDLRKQDAREDLAAAMAGQQSEAVFDLEKGPLLKAKLIRLEDEKYLFLLNMHHIISDGWSMKVLLNEIVQLYNTFLEAEESPLAPLRIHYKDYAAWHNDQLTGSNLERLRAYWLGEFSDEVPVLNLPTDYARPRVRTSRGNTVRFDLDEQLCDQLREVCHRHEASMFMTLLTQLNILLARYTGQNDIVVGSPIAGRNHPDLENQIGMYLNLLALRTRLRDGETFAGLLYRVKQHALKAFEHQLYPFDELVAALDVDKDERRSPLFSVLLQLQNLDLEERKNVAMEGVRVSYFPSRYEVSKYDLTFTFNEAGNRMSLEIEYSTDLFREETIRNLAQKFFAVLSATLGSDEVLLSDIHLYTTEQEEEEADAFLKAMHSLK